jgi:hypothetical protein
VLVDVENVDGDETRVIAVAQGTISLNAPRGFAGEPPPE